MFVNRFKKLRHTGGRLVGSVSCHQLYNGVERQTEGAPNDSVMVVAVLNALFWKILELETSYLNYPYNRTAAGNVVHKSCGRSRVGADRSRWVLCTHTLHYPQSNGLAESVVKSMKKLVIRTFFSRHWLSGAIPRDITAHHRPKLCSDIRSGLWCPPIIAPSRLSAVATDRTAQRYNERADSLPSIRIGTPVRIQDTSTGLWDQIGIVVGIKDHSYYRIEKPSGRVLWRNRRFLRTDHTPEAMHPIPAMHSPIILPPIPAPEVIPPPSTTGTDPPSPPPPRECGSLRDVSMTKMFQ
ncbi:hypothetical protein OUZ56_016936 [Daphnia magna]|uniref:Integrase catalytic domain-containing protein n=1 Tax=Daphnia magna TaxID=35525 RepID=A0ABR0ARP2_9CRUS|nr:hypothetical protein OUZ56_016936 [Daphnia magna]